MIEVQRKSLNKIIEQAHWQYLLSMESLIQRYSAKLMLAAKSYTPRFQYSGNHELLLHQLVTDLANLGDLYIRAAATIGFERGLRDLILFRWLRSYQRPVIVPHQVYDRAGAGEY